LFFTGASCSWETFIATFIADPHTPLYLINSISNMRVANKKNNFPILTLFLCLIWRRRRRRRRGGPHTAHSQPEPPKSHLECVYVYANNFEGFAKIVLVMFPVRSARCVLHRTSTSTKRTVRHRLIGVNPFVANPVMAYYYSVLRP
jgi:hypothetical protein